MRIGLFPEANEWECEVCVVRDEMYGRELPLLSCGKGRMRTVQEEP